MPSIEVPLITPTAKKLILNHIFCIIIANNLYISEKIKKMTLIEELKFRGFLNQCTNEETLNEIINSNKIKFYIGFDCTAKSLHVGSLIQIMIMRLFQKYGHTPIVLIGKGTTRIGDPSGKDETRKILSDDEIDLNAKKSKTGL